MKTMSQVARLSDAPETIDEARALIDQMEHEVQFWRSEWYKLNEATRRPTSVLEEQDE